MKNNISFRYENSVIEDKVISEGIIFENKEEKLNKEMTF